MAISQSSVRFFSLAIALCPALSASAALVNYATNGQVYAENFDSRVNTQQANTSTAGLAWVDDSTIPAWKAYHHGGGSNTAFSTAGPATSVALASGLVAPTNVDVAFFRSQSGSSPNFTWGTDVAFGSQSFNANTSAGSGTNPGSSITYGFGLINNTGETLTSFSLNYTWELWSANNTPTVADAFDVSYALGGTGVANSEGTWTATSLGFSVPSGSLSANTAGTAAGGTVTGIAWLPGQELWVRWSDVNWAGNDRGVGLDNVQFVAVPEPTSLASLAIGAMFLRRKRQA